MMRTVLASNITDLSVPKFRIDMMRKTSMLVRDQGELWVPLLLLIGEFIDGLAKPPKNKVRERYVAYLQANFYALCTALGGGEKGAQTFYDNFRVKAAHEFAANPPFGIGREAEMKGVYVEEVIVGKEKWTLLNIDRLADDFLKHLDAII
jgi:hypothetical protein